MEAQSKSSGPSRDEGVILGGRYHLLERIGEGAVSQVYRAQDRLLDRHVAVKIVRPEYAFSPTRTRQFHQELRAAARVQHPNAVSLFDYGVTASNRIYIVLELVEGTTLHDELQKGPLDPDRAARIGSQVASYLDALHEAGIVHRDIKPGNILLKQLGTDVELVKVADLGIATIDGEKPTLTETPNTVMGTASFMSPEQVCDRPTDGRSDLYSLGVVLFAALTGRRPFTGSPATVLHGHLNTPAPRPGQVRRGLPAWADRIVPKLLRKDPKRRYANARQLSTALRAGARSRVAWARSLPPS